MSDVNNISAAGKAIAAFKSTQALSRGDERTVRRPRAAAAEAAATRPERTLQPVRTTLVEPAEDRAVKAVQVGDRRLAARGSIVDILV